jgi:cation transport regulator ChaB|tara:strand:- start:809 stop:1537 length:729 start_codon:yes stop_codon:yes gene_type:complete
MPITMLKKLPKEAKAIWESTFKASKVKYGPDRAAKIAWAAVKKKYQKLGNKWVLKGRSVSFNSNIKFKSQKLICRSVDVASSSNDYFIEGYIATKHLGEDGIVLSDILLRDLEKQIREFPINVKGDLEHVGTRMKKGMKVDDDLPSYEDFMKIVDTKIDENGLWAKVQLDKYADNFPVIWNRVKEGFYDAFSIEMYLDKSRTRLEKSVDGYMNVADGGSLKKFTLTGSPIDKHAKVTSVYTS